MIEHVSSRTVHTNLRFLPTVSDDNLPETDQCGELELVANGTIKSPGWQDYYPVNSSCVYLITARNNRSIDLEIDVVWIRLDDFYMKDHIIIYSGKSEKNPVIAVINGYNQLHHFITNTSQILIKFVSLHDSYYNRGFSITYKETVQPPLNLPNCGGYVKQSGRIYISNYNITKSIEYGWTLQANEGKKANVNVYIYNLVYGKFISFYNGPNDTSSLFRGYNNLAYNQNATYTSDNKYLYVRFLFQNYHEESGDTFYPYSSSYFEFFLTD